MLEDGYVIERSESRKIRDLISTELLVVIKALQKEARAQEQKGEEEPRVDGLYISEVSFLQTVILNRLVDYPTSLDFDRQLLSGEAGSVEAERFASNKRLRMALEVRIGEKEILNHLNTVLEEWIRARYQQDPPETFKKRKQPGHPDEHTDQKSKRTARS